MPPAIYGRVRLRFIQLHDIALIAARMESGDWAELLTEGAGARGLWWALPPLKLAARYYPTAIPQSIIVRLEPGCPWLLRQASRRHRLADVSWSRIRIQAFPGIEWSRSPAEAFKFIASRVFPDRVALSELNYCAATQPWASAVPGTACLTPGVFCVGYFRSRRAYRRYTRCGSRWSISLRKHPSR